MTIEGSRGTYRLDGEDAASEISDLAARREGGSVLLAFRWAHRSGRAGRGAWLLLGAGGGVLDGLWSKDGGTEGPWHWSAVRQTNLELVAGPPAAPAAFVEKLRAGEPQHLVFYGTSLTSGSCSGAWVDLVCNAFKDAFPSLVTHSDSAKKSVFSDWALENLHDRVLAAAPDVLFLEFAVNDAMLTYRLSPAACRRNLKFILDCMQKVRPGCECILMTTNPCVDEHSEWRPRLSEYYELYREVARERGLRLLDLYPEWLRIQVQDAAAFQAFIPDGLHPSSSGCSSVVAPAVLGALGLPASASGVTRP